MTREFIRSLQQQPSDLSCGFFAASNVEKIQEGIRDAVRAESGHNIDRQSTDDLLIIMRAEYLLYGAGKTVDEMNDHMIDIGKRQVIAGIRSYMAYLEDVDSVAEPLEYGRNVNTRGLNRLTPDI